MVQSRFRSRISQQLQLQTEFDPLATSISSQNDDDDNKLLTPPQRIKSWKARLLQFLAVFFYLLTWVANGEILQHLNGNFYNKPAAITWFSYNFMMLSFPLVVLPVYIHWGWYEAGNSDTRKANLRQWMHRWAGTLGLAKAIGICTTISYLLLALNIFMVLGLECISVSLSNAIFQLQTPLTIILSVLCLKDRFQRVHGLGMLLSMFGVAMIVLPPLDRNHACAQGIWMTMASASIGGLYLTSWRWLETKNLTHLSPREGLVDAHMTLSMIGLCNLLTGWPVLIVLHYTEIEEWVWPSSREVWSWLVVNGLVEYLFDASCAVAISATSPIIVSMTAPLTIPLSMIVDNWLHPEGSMIQLDQYVSLGGLLVLFGTVMIEAHENSFWCCRLGSSSTYRPQREKHEGQQIV